jgi:hypothetical protein
MSAPIAYLLKPAAHPWSHWGDYGDMLFHGMTSHLSRKKEELQLERTAPFMPDISFPGLGDIVVTERMRQLLFAKLPSLEFRPVAKRRIVALDWESWPRAASSPAVLPEDGSPESYILANRHSKTAATELGSIWELIPTVIASAQGERGRFMLSDMRNCHLVRATLEAGYNYVSPALKAALEDVAGDYVSFSTPPSDA